MRLINGECLAEMDKLIEEGIKVDTIITDIPYGTTACKWDSVIPFEPMWERLNKLIKDNGAIVLFGSEPFSSALRMSNIKNYKYDWYWEKNRPSGCNFSHSQPMRYYENVCVFYKKKPYYDYRDKKLNKPYSHCLPIYGSDACPLVTAKNGDIDNRIYKTYEYTCKRNKLMFNKVEHPLHPTQKPIELLEYLVKTYTQENEIVLDFTAGSMSTVIACLNTKRDCIAIELDENYFNIGCNRVKQHILDNNIKLSYNQVKEDFVICQDL